MAIYIGGKKVQETGGKYQSKGIPQRSSTQPHHTTRERFGSPHSEKGFQWKNVPIKGGKPAHTPAEQFENLRLRKNELQHIPYSGDDSGRNMYQMGIQNLLERGDPYKKAYLQKYPIGGRINLGVPAAFNAIMSKVVPGVSSIANMFGDRMSSVGQGIKNVFSGPTQDLGFHKNKFMQDLSQTPSRFWNDLQKMLRINQNPNPNLADVKTTQTTEDIVSPAALSRTDSVLAPQFLDEEYWNTPEQIPYLGQTDSPEFAGFHDPRLRLQGESVLDRNELSQLPGGSGNFATMPNTQFQNLDPWTNPEIPFSINPTPVNFAHGGEIQDDAYARLKAINDSMHEM